MAEDLIISVSGMRGIVGEGLTTETAGLYAAAFAAFLQNERRGTGKISVCIGRDSRPSGERLAAAFAMGLSRAGIDVVDLSVATTPGVGIMARKLGCEGAAVITASHNPSEYNGIKLLLAGGQAPPPAVAAQIREFFWDISKGDSKLSCAKPLAGRIRSENCADIIHCDAVMAVLDVPAIKSRGYRVVVDSVNGAGGPVTKRLLGALGCRVWQINGEPHGHFGRGPEPIRENLSQLCDKVRSIGADIGFAQDPDADRLAVVDEAGNAIGEEYTLALAASCVLAEKPGDVATNLSTSRMIEDVASRFGRSVYRTPVGEANVADAMLRHNCAIGGEGNGGVIDLRVGPVRDSLVGMGLILQLMVRTARPVGILARETGGYFMLKEKFPAASDQVSRLIDLVGEAFPAAEVSNADGLRLDLPDGWLSIRASNTEPVARLIVEASDEPTALKYRNLVHELKQRVG